MLNTQEGMYSEKVYNAVYMVVYTVKHCTLAYIAYNYIHCVRNLEKAVDLSYI